MKLLTGSMAAVVLGLPLSFSMQLNAQGCDVKQLLTNADFDLGPGMGWVENGADFPLIESSAALPVSPHSGEFAGWMGGVNSATHALYQDVLVPAGTTGLTISGYRLITTNELSSSFQYDVWTASIRNEASVVLETLGVLSNLDHNPGWVGFSYGVGGDYAAKRSDKRGPLPPRSGRVN